MMVLDKAERRDIAKCLVERFETELWCIGGLLHTAQKSRDRAVEMGADADRAEVAYQIYRDFLIARARTAKAAAWRWAYHRADSCPGALYPLGYDGYISRLLELVRTARHENALV
ncbi:MAG: hypothetical protein V3T86_02960 [Planctomycetota bacterium]